MRIHLSKADVSELEEQFVLQALRSGWITPLGPSVDAFEQEIAERVGVRHALALSSGTAALHLALLEAGADRDSVVVVPTLTFTASANAVSYTGAQPVFVDCLADGNVDPHLLLEAIHTLRRRGAKVAAAMTVDLFGKPCDYSLIEEPLANLGVPLIEDAAEALGATYGSRSAGSFGNAAALSFNGNKIITTSGGGMLLSNDSRLIAHARKLSTQARESVPWYEHTELGYNYRMSNILAALGRAQLQRLDLLMAQRREIAEWYREALAGVDGITFLYEAAPATFEVSPNYWLTCIRLDPEVFSITADQVVRSLLSQGIEGRHVWKPMHLQPLYSAAPRFLTGMADSLFAEGIALPSTPTLTKSDVYTITDSLLDILATRRTQG